MVRNALLILLSLAKLPITTDQQCALQFSETLSHFTFWTSLSLRPKTEAKRLNFGFSPVLRLTSHRSMSSLTSRRLITDFAVFFIYF